MQERESEIEAETEKEREPLRFGHRPCTHNEREVEPVPEGFGRTTEIHPRPAALSNYFEQHLYE